MAAGNGGRFSSGSGDGFYYLFLIANPSTGDVDVGFSSNQTDPTGEANYPAGFTLYRYIGAWHRAAGAWVAMKQVGNRFVRTVAAADDGAAIACSASTAKVAVTAPPGTTALVRARLSNGTTITNLVLGDGDSGLSLNVSEASMAAAGSAVAAGEFQLRTDASSRISHRASGTTGSPTFSLRTYGWIDESLAPAGAPMAAGTLRTIACAFKYDGSGWVFISDANHQPIGVSAIARVDIGGGVYALQLTYDFTATKVGGLMVSPDESFVGTYFAGASVGLTFSYIYLKDSSGAAIDPNSVGTGGNFWAMGTMIV